MATFDANQGGTFTPSTTTPGAGNYTMSAVTAGAMGKVKWVNWGGRGLTSTGYRTRWTRSSTDPTGAGTALVAAKSNPITTAVCACNASFATTNPTLAADPSGNLLAQDWNLLGGGGVIVMPIGGEWFVVQSSTAGTGYIQCINVAGVDANASTYGVSWEE